MAPFTQFPEETWAQRIQNQILKESLGAKLDFIISNVGYSLKMWNVGESRGSWLLGVRIQVKREKEKFVALCLHPP